jgi:predicted amidohydrolase
MSHWNIAAVQMDCRIGDTAHNLRLVRAQLREATGQGAKLVIFPECILTGYCFESKEEAWAYAEPFPGPSTETLARDCRELGVWTVAGMLEARPADGALFNSVVLIGPSGVVATYRKIHLPFLGIDRFNTPGDQPFAVHDLGGLKIGMTICYDGSFPESARCLMLLGADLVVLPTNWPTGALKTAQILIPARAMENNVYYAAVNRIGEERGFQFIGLSRILAPDGSFLAVSDDDRPTILHAQIDPEVARQKRIVRIPGKFEVDRVAHRRPEMYQPLVRSQSPVVSRE